MALQGLTVLAVVPARGGSKSIPRKNLAQVCGISLVGRAGKLASGLDWVDRAVRRCRVSAPLPWHAAAYS